MKTYSFKLRTDNDSDGTINSAMVERTRTSPFLGAVVAAYAFSGPYFQPDAIEVKELARDVHNALIEANLLPPNAAPPVHNATRDLLVAFLAETFKVNMERSNPLN